MGRTPLPVSTRPQYYDDSTDERISKWKCSNRQPNHDDVGIGLNAQKAVELHAARAKLRKLPKALIVPRRFAS